MWTKASGPGTVTFGTPSAVDTTATFSAAGIYVLRMTGSDGALTSSDDVTVTVGSGSGGGDVIFADGFESGNLSSWSSAATGGGDLSVTAAAARSGAYGLQAAIVDNTAIYVVDDRPAAESRYRARFSFKPNGIAMAANDNFYLLQSRTSGTAAVVRFTLRWTGSQYQLRGAVRTDGGSYTSMPWQQIPGSAWSTIEFEWHAATSAGANNGSLTLWIDGVQRASIAAVDNDTLRVESTRLGAVAGIDTGTRGTMFFDDFDSHRPA
jgi:hypothetical protein